MARISFINADAVAFIRRVVPSNAAKLLVGLAGSPSRRNLVGRILGRLPRGGWRLPWSPFRLGRALLRARRRVATDWWTSRLLSITARRLRRRMSSGAGDRNGPRRDGQVELD